MLFIILRTPSSCRKISGPFTARKKGFVAGMLFQDRLFAAHDANMMLAFLHGRRNNKIEVKQKQKSFRYGWTDTYTRARVDYSITEVSFKENVGAYGRINDFLEDLYARDRASLKEYKELVRAESEEYGEERGAEYVEYSDSYRVFYMDEKYVGVARYWDQYWKGAAHGTYGTVYYIFDRNSGSRMAITDVVNNSPEEICEIIAPYVEAAAAWGTGNEGWESVLLEEGRFFLSEEGIGIHFDIYEIDCYAAGAQEIIVPYGEFD